MALSEEEQRLLDQLEASLMQDDPRLARSMQSAASYQVERRRAAAAGLVFVVGLVLLVMGLRWVWPVSVVGFLLMFGATVLALTAWRKVDPTSVPKAAPKQPQPSAFTGKMEERWRRRQEEGR